MSTALLACCSLNFDDEEEENVFGFPANCGDGDSVVWKNVLVDNDLLGSLEDDTQFVDFVRLEGDSVLDLINEECERNYSEGGEIDGKEAVLCNGVAKEPPTPADGVEILVRKDQRKIVGAATDAGYKCGVCLLKFKIKAHLIRHMLLKHRQEGVHKTEKIYSRCRRCYELFKTTAQLEQHLKKTHKTTLFCDICLRVFDNKDSLTRHRKYHVGINPFACDVCKKECKSSSHLHFHRRTHFTKDLGYRCQHCDKMFSSSGNCQKHITRVHTHEKRFKCPTCSEAFVYPRQLKIHQKQVHASKEFGPHDCQDCNLHFISEEELTDHKQKVHYVKDRPYVCDQCPSRFKQTGHLKTHKLTHSGSKPFGCDICSKRFLTNSDLKVHKRGKHNKEKPFRCEHCEKAFIVGYLLKKHLTKAHGLSTGYSK